MPRFTTQALSAATWTDFAALAAAHNGVWGGCWCMGFHLKGPGWGVSPDRNRDDKQALVVQGRARAALVYDGADCVGWCQFGTPDEVPRIKNAKAYLATNPDLPDWRITCFFVGKGYRGKGVAAAGLAGAVALIAGLGGGRVEGYPEDTAARSVSGSFLYNGTLAMFHRAGFVPERLIGKHKWVVGRQVFAVAHA